MARSRNDLIRPDEWRRSSNVTTQTTSDLLPRPRRARRIIRDSVIAIVGVGVGLGAVAVIQRDDESRTAFLTDKHVSVTKLALPAGGLDASDDNPRQESAAELAPINDPSTALETFLDAEKRDDFGASYALLSADDRQMFSSPAQWEDAHNEMAKITNFGSFQQGGATDNGVTFTVELSLEPRLDTTIGAVAARATGTFTVRQLNPGDWRIAFSDSSLAPHFPDDSGAKEAVISWANARQRCERAEEWEGGLLGNAAEAYAERLCKATTPPSVSDPFPLDRASGTESVLAAFGPEAATWTRVVRVSGPLDLDVITAPLGEKWVVVGVIQTSIGSPS